jgi:hypothetical protein
MERRTEDRLGVGFQSRWGDTILDVIAVTPDLSVFLERFNEIGLAPHSK